MGISSINHATKQMDGEISCFDIGGAKKAQRVGQAGGGAVADDAISYRDDIISGGGFFGKGLKKSTNRQNQTPRLNRR